MFRGRFEHIIDDKGRASVPAKLREVLKREYGSDQLIITIFDSCLVAYPIEEWQVFEEKMKDLSLLKKEVKFFLRYFYSGAIECAIDDHGRILIPSQFRDHAHLKKEIVFVGVMRGFEIWDKGVWEEEVERYKETFDEISESMAEWMGL
ncbi:MAG: division/cell wall cluster transcriptional repressor MraZ [Deltaproteobacteria bacterium]|nr:division/cell wall cluster transcriptional repressor MraZ [Deltaproteobacteria bacterium]